MEAYHKNRKRSADNPRNWVRIKTANSNGRFGLIKKGQGLLSLPLGGEDAEFAHSVLSIRYGIQKNTFKGFG
jgi:hypothetical protein